MIKATVIHDSICNGNRIVTAELTFHRFVLAEFNTHRMFSRNSASSRAIPAKRFLDNVVHNPAWPIKYPAEQSGMQGGEELQGQDRFDALDLILDLFNYNTTKIEQYIHKHPEPSTRLHKSVLNRYLEPFMFHTVIVTATDWDNFFNQRVSPLAQPEIEAVARQLQISMKESQPKERLWHIPYIQHDEMNLGLPTLIKISIARCARVSYLTHDGVRDIEKDLALYEKLRSAEPPHWSPFEHVAGSGDYQYYDNFFGWQSIRNILSNGVDINALV